MEEVSQGRGSQSTICMIDQEENMRLHKLNDCFFVTSLSVEMTLYETG